MAFPLHASEISDKSETGREKHGNRHISSRSPKFEKIRIKWSRQQKKELCTWRASCVEASNTTSTKVKNKKTVDIVKKGEKVTNGTMKTATCVGHSTMPKAQTRWLGAAFEAPQFPNREAANITCLIKIILIAGVSKSQAAPIYLIPAHNLCAFLLYLER